ncbi:DegT/DnrJ/EryC1/StrS family aminotransferase [Paenibacillus albicereus]|uniref:DegT/DnrJ/EryC1/StrS family aminotransferase n=1 Tax=Paenibacillus albicereus TaxID=2726185 RepID=A0A6H2GUF6_9BACL|nr:DegT/DnrJ/EryC1/StrS family aminotransferase [Paenibacillus albicereus]QJC51025.1 DegT/DnrJ/EryC1/StrS family aminotransferase [Paenibacillus albicereus]
MSIAFYTGARSFEEAWPRLSERLDRVIGCGQFTNGPEVEQLERALERYTGARHAVAVGNATDALILLLQAAGIGPGDEVIVPGYSFFATASCVAHAGATPVFCDIDPATYAIDPAGIEAKITERTRAIMPVHLFTQMADMPAILDIARRHGLQVLEDSAEGIGMFSGGVHAGLHGRGGVLSFFPTKTLGAIGDAGMILTDDDALAASARRLRSHGQEAGQPYIHHEIGWNSRMDDVQAAVIAVRLESLAANIARRAHLAALYDRELAAVPQVSTPVIKESTEAANAVYYVYLIEADERDGLVEHLTARGIGTEVYYPLPLHLQPVFAELGGRPGQLPHAERAAGRAVGLPMYPDLTDEEARLVCRTIQDFYAEVKS